MENAKENIIEMKPKLEIIKITNPNWLGVLGPQIKSFSEKVNIPTITYETLYTYFLRTIQYGQGQAEFHVINSGKDVVAFAHWFVCDLPHRGVVFMDWIYSWNRMREPVQALVDEFLEFGRKNHAPLYKGTALNETIYRVFRKAAYKRGYEIEKTGMIGFLGRKK
ncbi:MAG: hypothetical protein ACYTFW_00855 [Planctomycetota bacterium]|jgi:hypothetical protein